MDTYITGTTIRQLRERKKLTQSELAERRKSVELFVKSNKW